MIKEKMDKHLKSMMSFELIAYKNDHLNHYIFIYIFNKKMLKF